MIASEDLMGLVSTFIWIARFCVKALAVILIIFVIVKLLRAIAPSLYWYVRDFLIAIKKLFTHL
jgi:hypothetical protein